MNIDDEYTTDKPLNELMEGNPQLVNNNFTEVPQEEGSIMSTVVNEEVSAVEVPVSVRLQKEMSNWHKAKRSGDKSRQMLDARKSMDDLLDELLLDRDFKEE